MFDASFDSPSPSWTTLHGAAVTDPAVTHDGHMSMRLEPGPTANLSNSARVQSAPIALTIGKPYELTGWIRTEKLAVRAVATATGASQEQVAARVRETGDLGVAAEQLLTVTAGDRPAALTVTAVVDTLHQIAAAEGPGSQGRKLDLLAGLLARATPLEARYLLRLVTKGLRLGIGTPTILDALAQVYAGGRAARPVLERAYNICCDLGRVAADADVRTLALMLIGSGHLLFAGRDDIPPDAAEVTAVPVVSTSTVAYWVVWPTLEEVGLVERSSYQRWSSSLVTW